MNPSSHRSPWRTDNGLYVAFYALDTGRLTPKRPVVVHGRLTDPLFKL
jgi:hypothetical protein